MNLCTKFHTFVPICVTVKLTALKFPQAASNRLHLLVEPNHMGLGNRATILDKNYETNVSLYKKMNCFYTCPFPPHSMLTKLHRVVSLSLNIDVRGERGLTYSYSESDLRIHEFYLNFCCCLHLFCPRLSVKKLSRTSSPTFKMLT